MWLRVAGSQVTYLTEKSDKDDEKRSDERVSSDGLCKDPR